ncbi:leghemoglobin reductase-like isoform X2 [Helianthus annuus]|uniref:leghemoglobin reductase-like isoform X2 n=1 Tax=Helianthus annuus TaxID=4232 RepID=UPI0016531524|nr:leghemoglobin reductase-like isoform X2 [Helianthus annuus]
MPAVSLLRSIFILLMKPKTKFANHGIKCESAKMILTAMMAHKDKVVFKITKGIESLFKKNKVGIQTSFIMDVNEAALVMFGVIRNIKRIH